MPTTRPAPEAPRRRKPVAPGEGGTGGEFPEKDTPDQGGRGGEYPERNPTQSPPRARSGPRSRR